MYNYYIKVIVNILLVHFIIVEFVNTTAINKNDPYDSYVNEDGLYDSNDNVIILNVTTLKNSIYESKKAWVVEFYNSWCGHCRRFAPLWKSLASEIVGWKDIIEIAAINCANDDNNPICREFKIMYYPAIRYFSPNTKHDSIGDDVEKGETVETMRHNCLKHLQKDQIDGLGLSWPNISPYRNSELQDIWTGVSKTIQYKFYLFEENNSFLGTEIILDLHNITNIQIRRITSDNQWLCLMFKITNFPALIVYDRQSTKNSLKIPVLTRTGVSNVIKDFLKSKGLLIDLRLINSTQIQTKNEIQKTNQTHGSVKLNGDYLYRSDLESALRYSLEREISLVPTIENVKMESLKEFLRVLALYFPFKHDNSGYLSQIRDIIENKTMIDGKDFRELIKSTEKKLSQVYKSKQQWIGCKGSTPTLRGYPCGLWLLWHTLTVNYAIDTEKSTSVDKPQWILSTMLGYIKNFFGCSDCADHFTSMAEEYKLFDVKTPNDAVLWLWKAHNKVNSRLAGDFTEDPEFPKIQYPSKENCHECKNEDSSWNEVKVLQYLKRKYSYSSIQYNNSDVLQLPLHLDGDEFLHDKNVTDQQKIGWDFTVFDISICVIVYVISATMLVLVCIKFVVKRSSKKKAQIQNLFGRV
ncbi:sulfhydryl oxidase 2-like [Cotesia glomerata]|uniref:Sulfhydryl oxidase n=1 Tax=Cotesia glomerata TaxID=32391 RepID=A0AAV7IJU6_COTGL|nr:sulfhydryl oxidase 2-like [Cotesia glomerata]KAH0554373.1 hypothetical protein KQX54_010121 [Cotesia glomerata]